MDVGIDGFKINFEGNKGCIPRCGLGYTIYIRANRIGPTLHQLVSIVVYVVCV